MCTNFDTYMCVCACDMHVLFTCCLHAFVFSAVYIHVHVHVIGVASVRKDHLLLLIIIQAYFPCGAIKYIHLVCSVH